MLTGSVSAQTMEYSVVPAMSSVKRLPTTEPTDGIKSGVLGFVLAKGEFEPASFVIKSNKSAKKVVLTPTDLKSDKGDVIPASAVDLKVLKVWYQGGTGWHSYFADATGKTQVPELLLNDETLIKVDDTTKDNYLRVTNTQGKSEYVWVSNPLEINVPFSVWRETVADAAKFQPFTLDANLWKQIWVTVEAPKSAEGLYKGQIQVSIDGKAMQSIPVSVRVLPFELPLPMTNYDLNRVYYTSVYNGIRLNNYLKSNGNDWKKAEARLRAEYKNLKRHNILNPMVPTAYNMAVGNEQEMEKIFRLQLQIYKESGMDTSVLFDAVRGIPDYAYLSSADRSLPLAEQKNPDYWAKEVLGGKRMVEEILGKDTVVYCFGWDEPGMGLLRAQRAPWKFLQENGLKTYSTAHGAHLLHAGYNEDFVNYGGYYSKEESAKWHAMGGRITSYANPHTGPENPDMVRRYHGMDLYLCDNDGTNNYEIDGGWNDFLGADYNFRGFNWIYPGTVEPINTIQFEAFREAIDDVKYATLLRQLANKAIASKNMDEVYAGKLALQYLALLDGKKADLNTVRLEMINHIMRLRDMMAK